LSLLTHGQIQSHLLAPYWNHAAQMVTTGYAPAHAVDQAMQLGCGYPLGPLAQARAASPAAVCSLLEQRFAVTGDPRHVPARYLADGLPNDADPSGPPPAGTGTAVPDTRISVVGTGTMGAGIALVAAQAGFATTIHGRSADSLGRARGYVELQTERQVERGRATRAERDALLGRVAYTLSLDATAQASVVVEAVAEEEAVKNRLFATLGDIAGPDTVLATTTSSLSVGLLGKHARHPERVIGMHFFNPAPVMKLVEVVTTPETSTETLQRTQALTITLGKMPVTCGDQPGFIVNALLFPYLNDAVHLHDICAASINEIDDSMRAAGLPMGPFELLDVVGLDVSVAIVEQLRAHLGWESLAPARSLREKVAAGHLGRKSGRGFHRY